MNMISTRGITSRYALALGLIALLSILAYFTLHRMVASQKDAAAVINVSGSQRWLSQRASAYSLRLVNSHTKAERENIRLELLQISKRMERNQHVLIQNNPSPQILTLYFGSPMLLDRQIRDYIEEINALAHEPHEKLTRNNPHLRHILSASASKLLTSLDEAVSQYQQENEADVARLQRIEGGALGIALFTLLMEALFIFRPMISRIRQETSCLARSEAHLRLIIDNAMDAVITADEQGAIKSFNPTAERIFGYTNAEALGKNIGMLAPEFYYNYFKYFHNYLHIRKGRTFSPGMYEVTATRKDGAVFPAEVSLSELEQEGRRAFIMIVRDVTKQKQDMDNLKKNEEKFRLLVESSQDGIIAYDKDIRYTLWNTAMEQITGFARDTVLGKSPFEVFPFLEKVGEKDSYLETIRGKTVKRSGMPYSIPQTGKYGYFESSRFPLYNTDRTIIGGMAIIRDITERVQTERLLRAEHAVTRILAESAAPEEALQKVAQTICEHLGWDFGGVWMVDHRSNVLRCMGTWHAPDVNIPEFNAATRNTTCSPGAGLPGRIWAGAKPVWITNVTDDENFMRAPIAAREGLLAAFGFPIITSGEVIGAIEFFSRRVKEPDEPLLNILDDIGSQIGQFVKRKEAESQLIKLSKAVEQSPSTIVITDTRGIIEYVNPKGVHLTGYTPEEVIGKNPRMFKSGKMPSLEYKRLWTTIKSGGEWRGEFHNRKKNGDHYWEHASISPIKDSRGVITHFIAIKEDITERKRFELQLEYLANHDPLTGLFNRRRFREELEDWIAQMNRHNTCGALLFIDLDNFKYVNDTLGHQEGDDLLIYFSRLLRTRLRETDILARIGGDEFAIILPFTDERQAQSIAAQIVGLVSEHMHIKNDAAHNITASIGITLFPDHSDKAEELLTYADLAMYMVKEKGRNGVCLYSPDQKVHYELRVDWENRIRDALKNDRFVLLLQPITKMGHDVTVGYEALLRMMGKDDALISPSAFLSIAERFGLIHDIDRWVARRAIRIISEQRFAENNLFLEVNLSGRAFNDVKLLPLIKQEIAETGINPENLVFEITETATIENIVGAQHFITTLREMGCRFGLDDFGVGFSSFSYLKQLPVDYLKIDGSFISELIHNVTDQHLVRAMVEVARGLGKQTVAEFVGCEKTVQLLSQYGVDYAQGHYIGLPGAVSEIYLDKKNA